jgi:hypothetical protein
MAPKTLVSGENLALASGLWQAVGMAKKRTKADRLERQTEQLQKRQIAVQTRSRKGKLPRGSDNWASSGGCAMTVPQIVEVVIIVIVIYAAVRFFRKRG